VTGAEIIFDMADQGLTIREVPALVGTHCQLDCVLDP